MKNLFCIADAGGTKVNWLIGNNEKIITIFKTKPLHPAVSNFREIEKTFIMEALPTLKQFPITNLFFYGAGYNNEQNKKKLSEILQKYLQAKVLVEHDLLGAARSVLRKQKGFVGIIGTGSILGYYDEKIKETKGGFGYLLGDELGGAYLGKRTLKLLLLNQLQESLEKSFHQFYGKTTKQYLAEIYKSEAPNYELGKITKWLFKYKDNEIVKQHIIDYSIEKFLRLYFLPLVEKYPDVNRIGFIGSIAFLLRRDLEMAIRKIKPAMEIRIVKDPLEGLWEFHKLYFTD